MARLLMYTSWSQGHVYPPVAMLLELAKRGHEIHVRTRSQDVDRLSDLGFASAPIDPRIEAIDCDDWRARTQYGAMTRLIAFFSRCAELEIPDFQQAVADVDPDLLIVDVNCIGATYVAESSGIPWAQYCPHPPPIRSADVPPHGLGWAPGRSALGRLRDRLARASFERITEPTGLRALNRQRAAMGLGPNRHWDDHYLRSGRFILFTAEPYEYPRSDWPATVRLVGPGEWEPPATPPAWLAAEQRPIILVTASTAQQDDARLIQTALDAFADEGVALVVTTAAHDPALFRAPPNARVAQSLPHGPIVNRAACVIAHGGQGITQKALAAGVPLCIVPFYRDQHDVARRVEVAGAGVRLPRRRLTPERLRAAVRKAMPLRPGAESISRAFSAAGGAAAAADAIEELLPLHGRAPDSTSV
jgi:UDP:flavonoid glycosyltransferase YjiC (YdhE family)